LSLFVPIGKPKSVKEGGKVVSTLFKTESNMNKEFINIVGGPAYINTIDQANATLGSIKKAIVSIKNMTPTMREYIAARSRIIREKFPCLRDDVKNIFQSLIDSSPMGEQVYNTNLSVGFRHSIEWWENESKRLYSIIKPTFETASMQHKKKRKSLPLKTVSKSQLRSDIPIVLIAGITNKKDSIEQACGFEVTEVLVERWAPNLKKVNAICESANKSKFGIFVCLCKNTCHAVSEIAKKNTKGTSNWIVLKEFKNNSHIVACNIRKAILAAGFTI